MAKLHLCVGFYPNGQYKCNTVAEEDLQRNIEYNSTFRPGRFYFVDGKYVCGGIVKEPDKTEYIRQCEQRIKDLGLKPEPRCTKPYV